MIDGIKRTGELEWEVPVGFVKGMRVPGKFFLSEPLTATLEDGAVTQLANVATLPGIVKHSWPCLIFTGGTVFRSEG